MHFPRKHLIPFGIIGLLAGGSLALFLAVPHLFSPNFDKKTLTESYDLATQRLTQSVKTNGSFTYLYTPQTDTISTKNNDIRQLMASRFLAQLASEDATYLPSHEKNLAYILRALYRDHGEVASIEYQNKSKLGGIAMGLRTLVASPLFPTHAEKAEKLARAILSLQQPDGSLLPRYKEPPYAYDADYLLTFYSGEAILALFEYYAKTNEKKRLDVALLSLDFYLHRYVEEYEERYYPAYVPRQTMALMHAYHITEEIKYADAIFFLNDKLIDEMLDRDLSEPTSMGRFYNAKLPQYGTPHSASDGVYTEGLAHAYHLALELDDEIHIEKYREALELATSNLMRLQYTSASVSGLAQPNKALGAIRTNATNASVRIDTTQHMLDAFHTLLFE